MPLITSNPADVLHFMKGDMTEIEELKKEIERLKITNQLLHEINQIQAERLMQWHEKLERRETDEQINELARSLLCQTNQEKKPGKKDLKNKKKD